MTATTWAIIGAGNMGGAVLEGMLTAGQHASEVLVCDADPDTQARWSDRGCNVTADPSEARFAANILLAVKPQVFPMVAPPLSPVTDETLVVSVMAGLGSAHIRDGIGGGRIIRVMPNTPCQIGVGMSALAPGEGATSADVAQVRTVLSPLGKVAEVDESMIAAVTAVSGSGPAYVFLLAESMMQGARQIGLDERLARTLVTQTLLGAASLLDQSGRTATELREAVTSPGGTTAAALEEMFEQELPEAVTEGILAARNRAIELDLDQ